MRFLLEMVSCCGSCSGNSMVKEEASLLVAGSSAPPSPTPRAGRVKGRKRWRSGANGGVSSAVDWRPSLTSICEENVLSERSNKEHPPPRKDGIAVAKSSSPPSPSDRNLKRKITSTPRTPSSSSREHIRHSISIHAMMPTFSPAPFMF